MSLSRSCRPLIVMALSLALAACGAPRTEIGPPPTELASFRLGHVVVRTDDMVKAPISRDATGEQWQAALDRAIRDRLGRIEGDMFYHIGVTVDGYALAPPGVPLVISPKSVLILSLNVLEDKDGAPRITKDPQQLTVFEDLSGDTVIGSGLTRSAEEQMESLSFSAALAIERWLIENSALLAKP